MLIYIVTFKSFSQIEECVTELLIKALLYTFLGKKLLQKDLLGENKIHNIHCRNKIYVTLD